jgi:hypothetical protein
MESPNFKNLAENTEVMGVHGMFFATRMHPNPRLYKYYYWVFWRCSPCEGSKFLRKKYRLSTKQAFELIEQLKQQKESYWVYNSRHPRRDPNNPFNPKSPKWKYETWAPSFDDDKDEIYNGFK